ncbi:MAG: leucine-rich repeat domain-containing protein, partial [Bacteroidaceae bacterium]|nr:leucine-rich repeat domain-containing protein [Bacteroidaceae bacterium]
MKITKLSILLALLVSRVASVASVQKVEIDGIYYNFKDCTAEVIFGSEKYSGNVAINEENFPDANFRAWLLEQRYGQDEILTEEEIGSITRINVIEKDISSLEGIKFFTALEFLYCSCNQLTTLDVSANTALQRLDCYDNQLTELDASANTALHRLDCYDNQLTSLDVSGCVALEELLCDNNQLTTLDLSGCTALQRLICYRNQIRGEAMGNLITSLNTCSEAWSGTFYVYYSASNEGNVCTKAQVAQAKAKNWNVKYVSLKYPESISSPEEYADYEGYDPDEGEIVISETFPDENFRACLLGQDYGRDGILTVDEIAGIKIIGDWPRRGPISSLEGINVFTALERLLCYGNQLTTLDVSANTALQRLDCSGNQLTALDLSANTALQRLDCYSNQISGEAMDDLIASLNDRSEAEDGYFNVYYHQSPYEANVCTKAQVAQAKAKNWRARFCFFDPGTHMEFFADYEGSDAEKKDIAIDETNFPDENLRAYLLEQDYGQDGILTHDEIYSITDINVNEKGIRSLEGINVFKVLLRLLCDDNQLTSLDVSANTALIYLSCSGNQLTTLNVSGCEGLQDLRCYQNQLTSLDVSKNTYLSVLHCYQNQIKGAAMNALVESLPTSSLRRTIYIYKNEEGNVMTTTQVAAAKAKGWTPYYYTGSTWREYAGSKPVDVAVDETNFPDENFRNWVLAQDYGQDGVLTEDEIAGVTEINVSEKNIASLKGIEYFTALTGLDCRLNQINETEMGNLVESLPANDGTLYVKYLNDANEQNVITTAQVAAAKAKGWKVYAYDGKWVEYDGDASGFPTNIDPLDDGEVINFADFMDESGVEVLPALDGNVVGNLYFNILNDNGGYDAEEGCIVITESTSDE